MSPSLSSVPSLSGTLLKWTDWHSLNSHQPMHCQTTTWRPLANFNHSQRMRQGYACCPLLVLIFRPLPSLLCCGLRQGASRAAKNMLRGFHDNRCGVGDFSAGCVQERASCQGWVNPHGVRMIVVQTYLYCLRV